MENLGLFEEADVDDLKADKRVEFDETGIGRDDARGRRAFCFVVVVFVLDDG